MILPMKKVSIVLLNKEREQALVNLRKLGLVHLERLEGNSEKLSAFKEYSSNLIVAESVLGEIKLPKKQKKNCAELSYQKAIELSSEIVKKSDKKKQLLEEISANVSELERFYAWGSVSLEDLSFLSEKGINIKLFEVPVEKYAQIDESLDTILVNNDKKTARFILLNAQKERPENLLPEAFEVPLPRCSTTELELQIKENESSIEQIDNFFLKNVCFINSIQKAKKILEADIEFENVNAGMNRENLGNENDLAWISGYVPTENLQELKDACKEYCWALSFVDPEDDDIEVPTKLKNNKFVSLIYPLTDFLGTVPGYHEYDISGWFLFFFTIFFGMIFGDGGYGLLVTIVALIMMLKAKMKGGKISPLLGLVTLVGFATVVWGAVTCTWFGFTPEQLPQWVKNLSIPVISNVYADAIWQLPWTKEGVGLTTAQNMQIFCFALALFQLSVAHIKGIKSNLGSLKVLGEVGALMQLWGLFYVVLMMVVNGEVFALNAIMINGTIPIGIIFVALVLVGFILSFVFSNYEGSIGQSVLESCKNIISVLLGVVNVFSDIVSYIRLWAVGLAGAAISSTVNEMAGPLLGHAILFIAAIALLVFGHGLNMILNLLSVIVHGVRLNTLEFSSHLGMSWSGFKYNPFRESGK